MAAVKVEWPSWRYGSGGEARVFEGPEGVPEGWRDYPFARKAEEIVAQADLNGDGVIEPSKPEIIKALRDRGVDFDARWGVAKLQALLEG